MTTPAIILGLLIAPLALGLTMNRLANKDIASNQRLGNMGITLAFCFTGAGNDGLETNLHL